MRAALTATDSSNARHLCVLRSLRLTVPMRGTYIIIYIITVGCISQCACCAHCEMQRSVGKASQWHQHCPYSWQGLTMAPTLPLQLAGPHNGTNPAPTVGRASQVHQHRPYSWQGLTMAPSLPLQLQGVTMAPTLPLQLAVPHNGTNTGQTVGRAAKRHQHLPLQGPALIGYGKRSHHARHLHNEEYVLGYVNDSPCTPECCQHIVTHPVSYGLAICLDHPSQRLDAASNVFNL